MQGVVTLLDDAHYAHVEKVWEELATRFGVRGMYVTSFPHFSHQVAEEYEPGEVESLLHELAARTRPFSLRTAGLGVFTVASPVLYVPIVRSPELAALHAEIWRRLSPRRAGPVTEYYRPEMWMPHITLAQGGVDHDQLGEIVRELSGRSFHWEMTVNNLSMIYDTGTEQGLQCRFNFDGKHGAEC